MDETKVHYDMKGLDDDKGFFDKIYSRFILRDFFAKIVPGFTLLAALFACLTSPVAALNYLKEMSFFGAVLTFGVSWIIGIAIQGFGEKWGLIRYFPKDQDNKKYLTDSVEFVKESSSREKQQRERFIVIKEACGNSYLSIAISLLLLIVSFLWSLRFCFAKKVLPIFTGLLVIVGIIYYLRKMHFIHVSRESQYVNIVLHYQQQSNVEENTSDRVDNSKTQ